MRPSGGTLRLMTPETHYARTTDGTHVAYQVHGSGPVDMVVERGWFTNLDHEWEEPIMAGVLRRLGSIGRVIRMDRRGSGLSDRIDHAMLPTVEDRVDDMEAVMQAAGVERAALIGIGHGAAIFSYFAAAHPDRTLALVIFSPVESLVTRWDEPTVAARVAETVAGWGTRDFAESYIRIGAPSRVDDDALVQWLHQDQLLSGSSDDAAALVRLAMETSVEEVLPAIHVPTLLLWREGTDPAIGDVGRRIAAMVPQAETRELPGQDLFLLSGDWRRGVAEIEAFILDAVGREPDADRVVATVLFSDIVGSTERAAAVGDAAWRSLVDRHHAAVRRALARHRGREIDTAGDGFFAAFDGPARAIRCALAMREALAELDLDVRIGLHAGECERVGSGLRGVAVNIGARIGAVATAGEILVSSTVRDLVAGSGINFEDTGSHELKGIPEPWRVYRVASIDPPK
jgi:class 3 adenylate cyclase